MSDASEPARQPGGVRRLSDTLREVKNSAADRADVVVELREATRMRLELLATDLSDVFDDIPQDIDLFDFTISSGLQPRFWIDAVSHVAMARDRRTYRFLRDTRIGRIVLAESASIAPISDQIARYVAERIVEHQRMMDGPMESAPGFVQSRLAELPSPVREWWRDEAWISLLAGLGLFIVGAVFGFVLTSALLWERIAQLLPGA